MCFYRTQNGSFIPSKIIGIHFTFISKIPGDILLAKMLAELLSTEQIFTETSHLVPLKNVSGLCLWIKSLHVTAQMKATEQYLNNRTFSYNFHLYFCSFHLYSFVSCVHLYIYILYHLRRQSLLQFYYLLTVAVDSRNFRYLTQPVSPSV